MASAALDFTAVSIPSSASATAIIEEDTDGDGVAENSDSIALSDGVTSYESNDVFGFASGNRIHLVVQCDSGLTTTSELTYSATIQEVTTTASVSLVASGVGSGAGGASLSATKGLVSTGQVTSTGIGTLGATRLIVGGGIATSDGVGVVTAIRRFTATGDNTTEGIAILEVKLNLKDNGIVLGSKAEKVTYEESKDVEYE